jgi:hypothetical protein
MGETMRAMAGAAGGVARVRVPIPEPGPGASLMTGMAHALLTGKGCHFVQVASRRADLELVGGWLADGLEVAIDSRHPVAELGAALSRQTERGRVGRVVVQVEGGWAD